MTSVDALTRRQAAVLQGGVVKALADVVHIAGADGGFPGSRPFTAAGGGPPPRAGAGPSGTIAALVMIA